jgi:hypothetical protein
MDHLRLTQSPPIMPQFLYHNRVTSLASLPPAPLPPPSLRPSPTPSKAWIRSSTTIQKYRDPSPLHENAVGISFSPPSSPLPLPPPLLPPSYPPAGCSIVFLQRGGAAAPRPFIIHERAEVREFITSKIRSAAILQPRARPVYGRGEGRGWGWQILNNAILND